MSSSTARWTSRSGSRSALLRGERGAELRLVAGTAQEQHEVTRDRERGVAVEILLDEREREVHAGGDARGGPHRPVAHEDRLGVDAHPRVHALQLLPPTPSAWSRGGRRAGRRAASTNAPVHTEAVRLALRDARAIQSISSASAAASTWPEPPATISVSIGVAALGRLRMRDDGRGRWTWQRLAVAAEHAHVVAALAARGGLDQLLGAGEHLERAGDVEALHARVGDDRDRAAVAGVRHAAIILRPRSCPQGQISNSFCHHRALADRHTAAADPTHRRSAAADRAADGSGGRERRGAAPRLRWPHGGLSTAAAEYHEQ